MSTQGSDDHHAVDVAPADVTNGALRQASVIRPTYVVSSSETRIIRKVGVMSADKVQLAIETLRAVL